MTNQMLVISTNVLAKHHGIKTDEGHLKKKKKQHKLLFFPVWSSDKNLETKVLFKKKQKTKKWLSLFQSFFFFYFLWPFSPTFLTICTKCRSLARSRRLFNDTEQFDLSRFHLSHVSWILFWLHNKHEALTESGGTFVW